MINSVTIAGNLTRDPELRSLNDGTDVVMFSVAVNDRKKDGDEWVDVPNFFDVELFGRRAKSLNDHLAKGRKVTVQGKLRFRKWEKGGETRTKVYIIASDVEYMDSGKNVQNVVHNEPDQYADDDIPF